MFGFWDFVGGRFSVWSAIGVLPLSVHFGYDVVKQFLAGGHSIDRNLIQEKSIQVIIFNNSEQHSIIVGPLGLLSNNDPRIFRKGYRSILSGSMQIRSSYPTVGYGK